MTQTKTSPILEHYYVAAVQNWWTMTLFSLYLISQTRSLSPNSFNSFVLRMLPDLFSL